ncbi:hypothetical protein L1887_62642 [Cichorium endivia]|nr:hypothetical protein L1887_62642 [Cichorium endivia]
MPAGYVEDAARSRCPRTRAIACRDQRHLHWLVRQPDSESTANTVAGSLRVLLHGVFTLLRPYSPYSRYPAASQASADACCSLFRAIDCRNQEPKYDDGSQPDGRARLLERDITHLCERLLDGAATGEGARAKEDDDGKHEGEDDPADPGESHERLGRVAVRERVALVGTVERAAGAVGKSSGAGEPEDPVSMSWLVEWAHLRDGCESRCRQDLGAFEHTYVDGADEEAPPAGKEEEAGGVLDALGWRVAVRVVVGHQRRGNHGDDEGDKGEQQEADGVAPADGCGRVDHCEDRVVV